jgi:hypothetical protein
MRRFVAHRTFARLSMVAALLALALFGLSAQAASADTTTTGPFNPSMDIRDYLGAVSGLDRLTDMTITTISLPSGRACWVQLLGPITVEYVTVVNGQKTPEVVTIPSGKNRVFGFNEFKDEPPGWSATITLMGVSTKDDRELLQLVFGAGDGDALREYVRQHTEDKDRKTAWDVAEATSNRFADLISDAEFFPNEESASITFAAVAYFAGLHDSKTGEPLFPSLQLKGVQALLTKMTLLGAVSGNSSDPARAVLNLICGRDMDKQQAKPAS